LGVGVPNAGGVFDLLSEENCFVDLWATTRFMFELTTVLPFRDSFAGYLCIFYQKDGSAFDASGFNRKPDSTNTL
jgi:hypothetical protein